MGVVRSNFRKGQRLIVTKASVPCQSGAAINISISCTGPLGPQGHVPFVGSQMLVFIASYHLTAKAVVNPTYSAGYIYASMIASGGGHGNSGSETLLLQIVALVGSR